MKTIPQYSTIELLKAALAERGYTHETIVLDDDNYTRFTSPSGNTWFTSNVHITYPFPSSTARSISDKKHLAYELAELLQTRVPFTFLLRTDNVPDDARLQMLLEHGPLIVKPNDSSLSRGLTLDISDLGELKQAIGAAKAYSTDVLIQEQVSGQEVRLVVLGGQVTAALLRETPRIIGDGVHTAGELLAAENHARGSLTMPYVEYPQLAGEGLEGTYIPQNGAVIELGKSTMIRGGASIYNVLEQIHPSYLQTAERLANALGKGLIVADIFIEDYTMPMTETNYAFIEFNMSPVFKLFYSCRDGKHYDILSQLVPLIDKALDGEQGQGDVHE